MNATKPSFGERLRALAPDFTAAGAVFFLGVPQGLAYATIAGLPPAMGLYAATLPAIFGSAFRSSKHVVVGPTNALSLLVGGAVLATTEHPALEVAIALALGVAVFQLVATVLRLSAVVDYISSPTVLGYITGAGLLIGIGQLHNLTATEGPVGRLWTTVGGWIETLPQTHTLSLIVAGSTVLAVLLLRLLGRKLDRKLPAAILVMSGGIIVNLAFGLESRGLRVVSDLSPIPPGLPPVTLPSLELTLELAPFALACAVLSLVESNAVARSIAVKSGQHLDTNREFLGQGVANLAAAFSGGYPVSGSLSRSALNQQAGAQSRLSGMLTGMFMIVVLLALAPILDHTPIACLAGLLLIVAWDLVDLPQIRKTFKTSWGDGLAFFATMIGTWVMSLDKAIYLGVAVSLVLFLRKARLLTIRELVINAAGFLHERPLGAPLGEFRRCSAIRLLHIEGALFFGSAGELRSALDKVAQEEDVQVIIVRVKRASGLDLTAADALASVAEALRERGKHLLLVGMTEDMMKVLANSGARERIGEDHLFPTQTRWFAALEAAKQRAFELVGGTHTESCGLDNARPFLLDSDEDLDDTAA
jgi:SulP family sulfate permease